MGLVDSPAPDYPQYLQEVARIQELYNLIDDIENLGKPDMADNDLTDKETKSEEI